MIAAIRNPDLFGVGNQFTHDMDVRSFGINPLLMRCGINPALWFLVMLIMMSKLVLEINPGLYIIYIDFSIVFVISVRIESRANELALIHPPERTPLPVDLLHLIHIGCVWFAFLGEPGPRGAGERRLIACTVPRARLSGCIPLACIFRNARNGRFCEPGSAHAVVSH
jgi:hypothetical protein